MINLYFLPILALSIIFPFFILRKKNGIGEKQLLFLCIANIVGILIFCIFLITLGFDALNFYVAIFVFVLANFLVLSKLSIVKRLTVSFSLSILDYVVGIFSAWGILGFPPG